MFLTDIKLAMTCFFGPCTPYQYRLIGPGKWDGARNAIENVEYNTYYPMQTRKSGDGERDGLYDGWIKLLKRVFMFVIFLLLIRFVFSNGYNIFSIT